MEGVIPFIALLQRNLLNSREDIPGDRKGILRKVGIHLLFARQGTPPAGGGNDVQPQHTFGGMARLPADVCRRSRGESWLMVFRTEP
jgi:hypothetical protein